MKLMKVGNIRELPNIIEHEVILSNSHALRLQHKFSKTHGNSTSVNEPLADIEKSNIFKALNECYWRIYTTKYHDMAWHHDISWPCFFHIKKLTNKYNYLYLFFFGSFIEIG